MSRRLHIGVIGEQDARPEMCRMAEQVGREIARRGGVLVCGGLGGVMEAAARGAVEEGGLVVGILPGTRAEEANPYVGVPVVTGLGEARNVIVVRTSDAVVAVGGSYGTLSEIAYALKLGVPVVGLGTWELSRPGLQGDPIVRARDAAEAVALAWELAHGRVRGDKSTRTGKG
ncbi:MAG: TIGR00725 family protein [Armatimonadota bacterium]|nr:TIGR00725 family protein [Armatimonadota bacterium]MDR5688774.1 TIGR00725 family protein [Armatimonadota bacterium]MDR7385905.1 TIGR00725 family protein [Armatimonadota bacterium]MDR7389952.1 TIGR00725 family protein [Armatimonadota bacterium]MDR7390505.1 TIGR00725 family protein [Armatimonadota bacterium]